MKCFFHNDMDGECAASLVAVYTQNYNPEDYYRSDYLVPLRIDEVPDGDDVWIVDFSFTQDTVWQLYKLIEKGCDIRWIDHHASTIKLLNMDEHKDLKLSIKGIRSNSYCGAMLTYMYTLKNNTINPKYLSLIDNYDCWKNAPELQNDSDAFKLGIDDLSEHGPVDEVWINLYNESINGLVTAKTINSIITVGNTIKHYIDSSNAEQLRTCSYERIIGGYRCLIMNRRSNSWVFGDMINEYPLVCVWFYNGTCYSYSLFTSHASVDCGAIAESYGGGGHSGAAGFKSDELLFK